VRTIPFVCANLIKGTELAANPRDDKLYLKPYVILEKKIKDGAGAELPIKVGIIGFVPPQIMMWDAKNLTGNVLTRDIVQAAKAWVPQMKEEGADIVIALSHSGIDIKPGEMMENASLPSGRSRGHRCGLYGAPASRLPGTEGFCRAGGRRCRKGPAATVSRP
jgi:2',3'-cyclic-nucleotide 2'-phosphodiesterase/3'-nucleotidase